MYFIEPSATVKDSEIGDKTRVFKNAFVYSSMLGEDCLVSDFCRVEDSKFDYQVWLYPNGIVYSSYIGKYSYAQKNTSIWHAEIGKYCSLSWNVSIGGGEHDFRRVTSHSMLYAPRMGFVDEPLYDRFSKPCIIGNDVWIGAGAQILRGVTIGDGAVIGAGAIVTKDVKPYTVVAGIPATTIGQRCANELIEMLLQIKWWDFPDDVIRSNIELFNKELSNEVVNKLNRLRDLIGEK